MTASAGASVGQRLRPFLPRVTTRWLAEHPTDTHEELEGSVVFVDISGFTKLSEKLAARGKIGAEEMADAINACFSELLRIAYADDGSLLKFGGDALLLLFTGGTPEEHAVRACRAAAGMRRRLREVGKVETPGGRVTLRMSVGVHTGTFHFFLVGESHRELIVAGPGTSQVVEMEGTAEAGEIVVSAATAALLPKACVGVAKGAGWLLRSSPGGDPLGVVSIPPKVEDRLLRTSVPRGLREFLLFGTNEPEHRQVAIAFLHFDDTDRLLEEEGPASFAVELERLVRDVQRVVDEHDLCFLGTDVDHDGGKIILTAGAPRSTGHDEERLLIAVREIADVHRMIPVRIGVHRGHVFVGEIGPSFRRTFTVMGDAVNLSARVMSKAEPGQVLVTREALDGSGLPFESTPLEPFSVKGKAKPVVAHELGKVIEDATADARSARFPLAGRAEEIATIEAAIAAARDGRGGLVQVSGEPGIGKSRLLEEAVARAEGFSAWAMHCQLYASATPYFPFRRALREAVGIRDGDRDEEALERLWEVVREVAPDLEPWLPLLGKPLDIEIPDNLETEVLDERFRRERMEQATGELLAALLPRPAIVTIEDAHRMDEASADLLRWLTPRLRTGPWLVLVSRRDQEGGFSAEALDDALTVRLGALRADEAVAALTAATEEAPLPPHVVRGLAERSAGNPLFLEELYAAVRQTGDAEHLPDSVEGLVTAQIDALRPRDRQLLRYASVLGDSFSEGLARIVSAHELGIVDRDVWRFLDGFVTRAGTDTLRFRNAIVRDVAYEGLTFRRRRSLHALVGETIERFADDPTDEAEILSLHFLRADDAARAWRYSHVAAERAAAIYANVEAATFYGRALEAARHLADLGDAERLRTLERLGDVRERAGLYDEAGRAYTEARKLCGDELCRSRLMLKQARIEDTTGSSSGALRAISRALRGLDGVDHDDARAVRAQLEVWYGAIRLSQGRPREAVRWCERAIEDARAVGEKDALAHALYVMDWAYFDLGRPELATHGDEVIQLYGELGDLSRQADAYNLLGNFAYWEGRWSEAIELYERGKERQQQAGDLVGAAMGTANVAEILTQQGGFDRAEGLTREALRVFAASGYRLPSAFAYGILGDIASRRGEHRTAARHYVRGLHLVQQGGDQHEEIAMLGKVAEDLLRQGEAPAALGLVDLALARAEPLGGAGDQAPLLHRLRGWSLAQTGRLDEAIAAFDEGLRDARERGWDLEVALALRGRASAARARGDEPDDAPEVEARAILERLGVRDLGAPVAVG